MVNFEALETINTLIAERVGMLYRPQITPAELALDLASWLGFVYGFEVDPEGYSIG